MRLFAVQIISFRCAKHHKLAVFSAIKFSITYQHRRMKLVFRCCHCLLERRKQTPFFWSFLKWLPESYKHKEVNSKIQKALLRQISVGWISTLNLSLKWSHFFLLLHPDNIEFFGWTESHLYWTALLFSVSPKS